MYDIASVYRKVISFDTLAENVDLNERGDDIGGLIQDAIAENSQRW